MLARAEEAVRMTWIKAARDARVQRA